MVFFSRTFCSSGSINNTTCGDYVGKRFASSTSFVNTHSLLIEKSCSFTFTDFVCVCVCFRGDLILSNRIEQKTKTKKHRPHGRHLRSAAVRVSARLRQSAVRRTRTCAQSVGGGAGGRPGQPRLGALQSHRSGGGECTALNVHRQLITTRISRPHYSAAPIHNSCAR